MNRKYLDDIEYTERSDTIGLDPSIPERAERFKQQRAIYGFDERETWNLDDSFYCWLYERLKMFLEKADNIIDLNAHSFLYGGNTYTQRELIDMIIKRLEYYFHNQYKDTYNLSYVAEAANIWSLILPTMWW